MRKCIGKNVKVKTRRTTRTLISALLLVFMIAGSLYYPSASSSASGQVSLDDRVLGIKADFPTGTIFSYDFKPSFIRADGNGFTAIISRERWYEGSVKKYLDYYMSRFILSPEFDEANGIVISDSYSDSRLVTYTARLPEKPDNGFDTYTYMFFIQPGSYFYRIMLKYSSDDASIPALVSSLKKNTRFYTPSGSASKNLRFRPVIPDNWTAETREVYDAITGSETVKWGIFTSDIYYSGINKLVPDIEEQVGTKFNIILSYAHINGKFPTAFMEKCWDQGRVVELTYQLTANNNLGLFGASPSLHIYCGGFYDEIRDFARKAAEFGKPFLFRLDNEMNSDWTSYSGVVNMSDPDIYVDVWRKIYKVFEEEGVNNAIWIFNPNNNDYPPSGWNDAHAYYPGDGYAQLIGITGYNTGTYYKDVTGESWRSFKTIYTGIAEKYGKAFGDFSWIITEFASSSIGGNKAAWIKNMFSDLRSFPQIKAAVWFSAPDYDLRPGHNNAVARPYWLDETPETSAAFRDGYKAYLSSAGISAGTYIPLWMRVSAWAAPDIKRARDLALVPDNLNSAFLQPVTRAEFCALAVRMFETVTGEEIDGRRSYIDTNDVNAEKMGALGVTAGVGFDRFAPYGTLTREQAAAMLSRLAAAAGILLPTQDASFDDTGSISDWALGPVGQMQASGIMSGSGNNMFNPRAGYSREQSIVTILRLYDKAG